MRCNETRPIIKFPFSAKCERTNDRSYPDSVIMSDDKTKTPTKRSKTEENVSL